jgi:N-hydroxyarylamine O-acetyltransferase
MDSLRPLSIEHYLKRIRCPAATAPTARFLAELQAHHLQSVPYENLDILAGRPLSLDIATLYGKIVEQERGGYCFELNALFAWLLRALGYEVVDCVARFWRDEERLPPTRRHHVLKVRAESRWFLVDVGVGGVIPVQPLLLKEEVESIQGQECYRLVRDARFKNGGTGNGRGSTHLRRILRNPVTLRSLIFGVLKRTNLSSAGAR